MSTDCPVIRCALWSAGRASCVDVNAAAAGPASFASSSTGFSTHDTMGTGSRRTAASFAVDADGDMRAHDVIIGPADDPA
jgi:hypothetical protein